MPCKFILDLRKDEFGGYDLPLMVKYCGKEIIYQRYSDCIDEASLNIYGTLESNIPKVAEGIAEKFSIYANPIHSKAKQKKISEILEKITGIPAENHIFWGTRR